MAAEPPPDRPPRDEPPREELPPGNSGSVDVKISDPELPAAAPKKRATTASVVAGVADRVVHAAEAIGEKVGDVVGDSLGKVGGVVGESLSHLPVMPKTRRGRVLARSILVSFCLVFAWITVIVGMQLRRLRPPDLRPDAERVLIALRDGQSRALYQGASARFREVELEDTFVARMDDLNRTLGKFREITAVVAIETNRGPGGRTARIDLGLEFERGATKGNLSFRWEDERWKLLGLTVEVPDELLKEVGTAEARRERVLGNEKELSALVTSILTRSFGGQVDAIWNEAAPSFQQMTLEEFRRSEAASKASLGGFKRVLSVTQARISPDLTGSSIDAVLEFDYATIKGSFKFTRIDGVWRLTFYDLVMPLPRVPT